MVTFDEEWARCAPWMQATLDAADDPADLEGVRQAVEAREAQFWPFPASCIVTYLQDRPEGRVIGVWLAGGSLPEIVERREGVEAWAKAAGCAFSEVDSRMGWVRALRPYGYESVGDGHVVRKAL